LTTSAGWETETAKEAEGAAVAQARPSPTAEPRYRPRAVVKAVPVEPPRQKPGGDQPGKKSIFRRLWDVFK
jgi:hypothetical protein